MYAVDKFRRLLLWRSSDGPSADLHDRGTQAFTKSPASLAAKRESGISKLPQSKDGPFETEDGEDSSDPIVVRYHVNSNSQCGPTRYNLQRRIIGSIESTYANACHCFQSSPDSLFIDQKRSRTPDRDANAEVKRVLKSEYSRVYVTEQTLTTYDRPMAVDRSEGRTATNSTTSDADDTRRLLGRSGG